MNILDLKFRLLEKGFIASIYLNGKRIRTIEKDFRVVVPNEDLVMEYLEEKLSAALSEFADNQVIKEKNVHY